MAAQEPIIAGVFAQESHARRAIDALKQAGFVRNQLGFATSRQREYDLKNNLLALGVSNEGASYYAQQLKAGNAVVSVRPDGRDQEAHDILHQYGGYDYEHQTLETQTAAGYKRNEAALSAENTAENLQDEFYQPRSLKLREEQLNVSKERVQTGEVGLHKEIVTERKTVDVPVTHEEVYVKQHPVSGGRIDDTTPIGVDENIRVPVNEEQVNIHKNTVVSGEVEIGKRTVQETQPVDDTVKREKLRVEQEGDAPIHGTKSDRFHPDSVKDDTA